MAIGPASYVGKNGATTSTGDPLVITTEATVSAGVLLVVNIYVDGNNTVSAVSDSAGNSWDGGEVLVDSGNRMYAFESVISNTLSTGGTITVDFASTAGRKFALAIQAANPNPTSPYQNVGPGATGTSTSPSVASGTLSQADTLLIALLYTTNPAVTLTEDADYTSMGMVDVDARRFWVATRTVASTASDTYNPTISASQTWLTNFVMYNGTGSAPPTPSANFKRLTLLGVG